MDAATDAAADAMVVCGREICTPGVTTCCQTTSPFLLACISASDKCPGTSLLCDGPEDCPGGTVCCGGRETSTALVGTSCAPICDTTQSLQLCHGHGDCPSPLSCLGASAAPGSRTCIAVGGGSTP